VPRSSQLKLRRTACDGIEGETPLVSKTFPYCCFDEQCGGIAGLWGYPPEIRKLVPTARSSPVGKAVAVMIRKTHQRDQLIDKGLKAEKYEEPAATRVRGRLQLIQSFITKPVREASCTYP
jgi:hypothetical protein